MAGPGAQKKRALAGVASATSNKRSGKRAAVEPDPVQDPEEEEEEVVADEEEAEDTEEDEVLIGQDIPKSAMAFLNEARHIDGCLALIAPKGKAMLKEKAAHAEVRKHCTDGRLTVDCLILLVEDKDRDNAKIKKSKEQIHQSFAKQQKQLDDKETTIVNLRKSNATITAEKKTVDKAYATLEKAYATVTAEKEAFAKSNAAQTTEIQALKRQVHALRAGHQQPSPAAVPRASPASVPRASPSPAAPAGASGRGMHGQSSTDPASSTRVAASPAGSSSSAPVPPQPGAAAASLGSPSNQAAGMWAPSGQHPPTSQEGRRVAWSDGEIILVRDGFLRFGKQWVKTLEWGNGLHLDDLPPNNLRFHPKRTNVSIKDKARELKNKAYDIAVFGDPNEPL